MVNLIIDNKSVTVPKGTTIMKAAEKVGINIPKLCYLEEINEIGACRVCSVEIEGVDKLVTSCNNEAEDGMIVYTNSPKARAARKANVELILSQHDRRCATCLRSGNCTLQELANDLIIIGESTYPDDIEKRAWNMEFPLIKDASKCIKCMRCIQICDKVQSLGIWDIAKSGARSTVDVSYNRKIEESDCVLCGQCITHCPVGALTVRNDIAKVYRAIADPEITTVIQIAPAIRTAWFEGLDIEPSKANLNKLVAVLKRIGVDYVFDTTFSADLTIMEEGSEFLQRYTAGGNEYPLFTSCCPAWVRFMKSQYPEMVNNLSSAKSPQQMFGATTKTWFAERMNLDPEKICCISIMPCVAKKHEVDIPSINDSSASKDVDISITTREVAKMVKAEHLNLHMLQDEPFDHPLGVGSGAGVIFGATGGVMEAALRSAYFLVTGKNPDADSFKNVRGLKGWKESEFNIEGNVVKVAVVSGLRNARNLVEALKRKEVTYDFVEVMACPGGCAGGGGQPIKDGHELAGQRGDILYKLDKNSPLRYSHENPVITEVYNDYLEKPLSHLSHKLLHTDHEAWDMPLSPELTMEIER